MSIDLQQPPPGGVATIDVAAERAITQVTLVRHYLNAAGAGLASDAVVQTVVDHLRAEQRIGG
ncbi:MAG: hypothetical protein JWQ43_3116, partial [Glaciihabitans sp.]|nr:hypothetical protein [Glaciihabitans sp.]